MRKVIMFNMVTLDGYFEGNNHDISWHRVDEEFNQFAIDQLNTADALLFGRLTYQMMASYWPSSFAIENDPTVAGKMNSLSKYVFSKTLHQVEWNNTQLINGDAVAELTRLKSQPGQNMLLFGSADLALTFTQHGLIDEYRFMLNPIVL